MIRVTVKPKFLKTLPVKQVSKGTSIEFIVCVPLLRGCHGIYVVLDRLCKMQTSSTVPTQLAQKKWTSSSIVISVSPLLFRKTSLCDVQCVGLLTVRSWANALAWGICLYRTWRRRYFINVSFLEQLRAYYTSPLHTIPRKHHQRRCLQEAADGSPSLHPARLK